MSTLFAPYFLINSSFEWSAAYSSMSIIIAFTAPSSIALCSSATCSSYVLGCESTFTASSALRIMLVYWLSAICLFINIDILGDSLCNSYLWTCFLLCVLKIKQGRSNNYLVVTYLFAHYFCILRRYHFKIT